MQFTSGKTRALLALCAALALPGCYTTQPPLRAHISPAAELAHAATLPEGSKPRAEAIARSLTKLAQTPPGQRPEVTVRWQGRDIIDTLQADWFIAASSVRRKNWNRPWHTQPGTGSPLVSVRESKDQRFVGTLGTTLSTTASLAPTPGGFEIILHDSTRPANTLLAHDFTAPIALVMRSDKLMPAVKAVLNANRYLDELGLYRITPFDPNKTPIVLVHGLKSTPEVWTTMINELSADQTIRNNYQIWLYSYPTGSPILYSSMRLRNELAAMRAHYDPAGTNPKLDHMVMVGHSMGGILTRMMVSSSSEKLRAEIGDHIKTLDLAPEARERLRQAIVFEPQTDIARAVFLAAPHRGSPVAKKPIVHLLSSFIRLPSQLTNTMLTLMTSAQIALGSEGEKTKIAMPNGLEDLDPGSLFMRTMADEPISPSIPYHSIIAIGKNGRDKPLAETDDSLVRYPSAHLDDAASEITVEASHNIYDHPQAMAEVTRILKLHLRTR